MANRSVRFLWLRSFIVVIVCIIVIALVFFSIVSRHVSSELYEASSATNNMVKDLIDVKLGEIQTISNEIAFDSINFSLIYAASDSDFSQVNAHRLSQRIQTSISFNTYLDELYIYYPAHDYVIGNLGCYPSRSYFLIKNLRGSEAYFPWAEHLNKAYEQGYQILSVGPEDALYYIQRVPASPDARNYSVLFAKISRDAIIHTLAAGADRSLHDFVGIRNSQGSLFAYSGDSTLFEQVMRNAKHPLPEGTSEEGKTFVNIQSSAYGGLQYVLMSHKWALLRLEDIIFNMIILFLTSSLVISLCLSIYLTNRNNKPIFSLLGRLDPERRCKQQNEYAIIQNEIDKMLAHNSRYANQIRSLSAALQQSVIYTLVKSENRNDCLLATMLKAYNMEFVHPYFIIVLMRSNGGRKPDNEGAHLEITDFTNETEADLISGYVEDTLILLVNFDNLNHRNLVRSLLDAAAVFFGCKHTQMLCGVSEVHESISDIYDCYFEALNAIDSSSGGEIAYFQNKGYYQCSERVIFDFYQRLADREYQRAAELLPVLCGPYLAQTPAHISRCRKYAIINQVLEIINRDLQGNEALCKSLEDQMFTSSNIVHLQRNLEEILQKLFENSTVAKSEGAQPIYEQVKEYIDCHYTDPMLGLYSIADAFKISSSYISRTFKQHYNLGVIEYINRIRIEKAKAMMSGGEENVKTIAMKVGFSSDINFIRVFKKYENTTPGKFKNS